MKKIILSTILLIILAIAGGVYYVLTNLKNPGQIPVFANIPTIRL